MEEVTLIELVKKLGLALRRELVDELSLPLHEDRIGHFSQELGVTHHVNKSEVQEFFSDSHFCLLHEILLETGEFDRV